MVLIYTYTHTTYIYCKDYLSYRYKIHTNFCICRYCRSITWWQNGNLNLLTTILVKPGIIELREVKTPSPSRGEILVKIRAALTCGTDLKAYKRGHPMIPMPGVFGHEFSGIVAAVGRGVRRFKEGDGIMAVHSAPCLNCIYCKKRLYNLCEKIMDTKVLGAFAEYIVLPSHIVKQNVYHKPENITFEESALLEPLSCVVHGIESLTINKGDNGLIIGAGPIGLLHSLLLKEKGVLVTIIDKHFYKLRVAKKVGADFISSLPIKGEESHPCTPLKREDISSTLAGKKNINLNKITNNIGFDYLFECTGIPEVWESSVNYLRRGGTVILFGGCPSSTRVTYDTERIHYDEITLKGVFHYTPTDVRNAYNLLCSGKLEFSKLISGRYSLKNIQKAFDNLSKGKGIKYAIIP